jgi:hypothetical protein
MADAGVTFFNTTTQTDPNGGDSLTDNLNVYYDVCQTES